MNTMQQAVHIFKKDVRFLRVEIGVLVAVAALLAWTAIRVHLGFSIPNNAVPSLVPFRQPSNELIGLIVFMVHVAAVLLTARAIQADPVPGTREFWVTRPYRWKSILAAKATFIIVCVNVPILLARIAIVVLDGFPLTSNLEGLFWSQLLMTLRVLVPAAALAAMTAGVTPFLFTALPLLVVETLIRELLLRNEIERTRAVWPTLFDWIRSSAEGLILASVGLLVVYIQYRYRRTARSRILGLSAVVLGLMVYIWMPLSFAMDAQSRIWRSLESSAIQVHIAAPADKFIAEKESGSVPLDLPVELNDVPEGMASLPYQFSVRIDGPDHLSIKHKNRNYVFVSATPNLRSWREEMFVPVTFLESTRGKPLTLRGSVVMLLFKRVRTVSVPFETNRWVDLPGGFRCFNGLFQHCEKTSTSASPLITIFTEGLHFVWSRPWTIGPNEASMDLNPVDTSSNKLTAATVVTVWDPVATVRRDFEIEKFLLTDYVDIEK